jgi:hypothetical protein
VRSWKRCAPEAQLRLFVSTRFSPTTSGAMRSETEFSHGLGQERALAVTISPP